MQCFRASVFGRSFVHPIHGLAADRPLRDPIAGPSACATAVPVSGGGPPCLIDLTTRATSRQLGSIQHPTSRRSGRGPAHLYKSASVRSLCRCEHAFAVVEDLSFHRELTSTNIAATLSSTWYNHRGIIAGVTYYARTCSPRHSRRLGVYVVRRPDRPHLDTTKVCALGLSPPASWWRLSWLVCAST